MSRWSIICLTGPSAAFFLKSCWLCRLIHSFRSLDVFVPVCQRADAIACYPALCIKWRYRDLVHARSVHCVALTPQDFHFVHKLFLPKERFFVLLVRYLFSNHNFSPASPTLYFSVCVLDRVHLRSYHYDFLYRLSSALVLHLAQNLLVSGIVKWVVFGVVACVIQS